MDVHLEVLNAQKYGMVSALRKIFITAQWLVRCDILCKLTHCTHYLYDEDESVRNTNLLLKHSHVLANIGRVEAPEIGFVDSHVN